MISIHLPRGTPFTSLKELVWDRTFAQNRCFFNVTTAMASTNLTRPRNCRRDRSLGGSILLTVEFHEVSTERNLHLIAQTVGA